MIIAIDFDGTCVMHEYPAVGRDIGAQPILKRMVDEGHQLILYTMRSDETLADAVNWFKKNDISLFGVNHNPDQHKWTRSPKVYAHLYIDDAALGTPVIASTKERPYVDWLSVEKFLVEKNIIYAPELNDYAPLS